MERGVRREGGQRGEWRKGRGVRGRRGIDSRFLHGVAIPCQVFMKTLICRPITNPSDYVTFVMDMRREGIRGWRLDICFQLFMK